MAAASVAVAVGSGQPPPLLLGGGEEPLSGQFPELVLGVFSRPSGPLPMPKILVPELVPVPPEPIIWVHEVPA